MTDYKYLLEVTSILSFILLTVLLLDYKDLNLKNTLQFIEIDGKVISLRESDIIFRVY